MNAPEKASSFGLSLASRLCSIVNDSPATSVETVLAEYLLLHYNMLDTLNIYQFAEACRVPRSSIHRFCGKIGYANFSELKLSCRRETDSYRYPEGYALGKPYDYFWNEGNGADMTVYQDSLNPFYNNSTDLMAYYLRPAHATNANIQVRGGAEGIAYSVGLGF